MTTAVSPDARFGTADLHAHTAHGDGMVDAQSLFERIERMTDLDVVAVTDHDDVRGALVAREAYARGTYHFEFVPGIEVTTWAGHLLALWVEQPIRSFQALDKTIAAIHAAGGLAVVPHPFSYLTRSVGQRTLEHLLARCDAETRPDAIEVANSSVAGRVTAARALRMNRAQYGLAETGGSDAHFPEHVGSARTVFRGRNADDLRRAIVTGSTAGQRTAAVPLREIGIRRLMQQQVRGLSTTPRKVLGRQVRQWIERAKLVRA